MPHMSHLGMGVEVTDVEMDKQRGIDTRSALDEILKGQPDVSRYDRFYVKP